MTIINAISRFNNPNFAGYTLNIPTMVTPVEVPVAVPEKLVLNENDSMTDYGNGRRFIHQHGDNVCYVPAESTWYIWNGIIWKPDTCNQIEVFAQNTARSIFKEADSISDRKYQTELYKWGRSSCNHAKYSKMLKVAASHLPVGLELFDNDKMLLGVDNGTIDLKTGILMAPRREDRITKLCNVKYDPNAKSELWLSFLDKIFDGNVDLIRYVQKMVGYCLTGDIGEKCFFILLGESGDNGKSVFMNVLMWLLGDYAIDMPIDSILERKPGASSNDLVRLRGSRLVSCSEANRQYHFNEALLKRLTGSDPVTARALYKEHITFKPEGKILIATNRVPKFDKRDTAFDSRVRMIPFDVTIPKEEQDSDLTAKLHMESEGILSWAVEGCVAWHQEKLGNVPVNCEQNFLVERSSSVEDFINTACDLKEGVLTGSNDLHTAYLAYHELRNDKTKAKSIVQFAIELGSHGIAATHKRDCNYRVGIAPKAKIV